MIDHDEKVINITERGSRRSKCINTLKESVFVLFIFFIVLKMSDETVEKKLPLHFGLTQQLAQDKYSTRVLGMSAGVGLRPEKRTTRPANSSNEGGLIVISCTNLLTRGLSRRLSCK